MNDVNEASRDYTSGMKFYSFASHSRTTAQLSRGRVRPVQHFY